MAADAAVRRRDEQLGLYEQVMIRRQRVPLTHPSAPRPTLDPVETRPCAGCRAREARYGFRDDESQERPRTLCFECFRMELDFRRRVAAQRARGWNAEQAPLPLADTLQELTRRRRRAQIAARRALA